LIDAFKVLDLAHRQIVELKQQVAELTAELATERTSLASLGREFIELYNTLNSERSNSRRNSHYSHFVPATHECLTELRMPSFVRDNWRLSI
jgi:hypothetical protein